MTDFKSFLKILKSKFVIICVYVGIFVVIMTMNIHISDNEGGISYTASDFNIAVIDHDQSLFSKSMLSYIEKNMSLVDIINTEEGMEDALFERVVEYILIIPEHYQEDILAGKSPVMQSKKVPDAYGAKFAEAVIGQYVDTFHLYQLQFNELDDTTIAEALVLTDETVAKSSDVTVKNESVSEEKERLAGTFNFGAYIILACVIWVVGEILAIYFEKNISKRMNVSPVTPLKQNKALVAYSLVCMIIVWGITMIVYMAALNKSMMNMAGILMTLNLLLISMIALACGFAIAVIFHSKNARSAASNVIALGFSFISGVFVPLSMLSSEVKSVAAFTPTYWYVRANESIAEMSKFSLSKCKDIFMCFGIEILFFVTVIAIGMVSKKNRE